MHRTAILSLSSVANHFSLRCDAKYRMFWGINGAMLFPEAKIDCYSLKRALVPFNRRTAKKGELDSELELIELDDVEKRSGVIISSSKVTRLQSAKLLFGSADILTTRLRPNLGKTILNDVHRVLAGTTEWIPLKLNHDWLHPLLVKWYLLSTRYVNNAERLLSGKEHPRVAESDIFALRVPFPSSAKQQEVAGEIVAIEEDISKARSGLRKPEDTINELLCEEFGYPLREHRERERAQYFTASLHAMTAGFTLRNSTKFHHPGFELIENFLSRTPHERVKAFVVIPIRLGVTVTRSDFVEGGAAYYVHPGATKRQEVIDTDDCHQVTEEFYISTQRRFGLRRGDVVLNRAGEGTIGKSGFWDSDKPAIASDFTMRIRFNDRINPRFAWFYFQSVMFQSQVAREKRGMGNMTNIFPPELERMLIVTCNKTRQDAVVHEITVELQRRTDALATIESKRIEIAALIEKAVRCK
jgi:restriction endonuclease S subunit